MGWPDGTDLSIYSQDERDTSVDSLNIRPLAQHNWHTSPQVVAQILARSHQSLTAVQ